NAPHHACGFDDLKKRRNWALKDRRTRDPARRARCSRPSGTRFQITFRRLDDIPDPPEESSTMSTVLSPAGSRPGLQTIPNGDHRVAAVLMRHVRATPAEPGSLQSAARSLRPLADTVSGEGRDIRVKLFVEDDHYARIADVQNWSDADWDACRSD